MKLFEHAKPKELDFELDAVTLETGRVYTTPQGKKYPSITTVLGEFSKQGILEWREKVGERQANKISGRASRRGNELHLVCEDYLKNELTQFKMQRLMPHIKQLFLQLRPVLDMNVNKVICLEQPLYSDELKIAGRVDGIVEWNGTISVIDYKTSTKSKKDEYIQNYFMQCSAYCEMFEELTGTTIDQFIVAVAIEEENAPQIFIKNKSDYLEPLKNYIRNYHASKNWQV